MKKNEMKNLGLPLAVDFDRDLPAKKDASFDSWYVICNFEANGKKLAFEWHQQSVKIAMMKLCTAEFLITDGSKDMLIGQPILMLYLVQLAVVEAADVFVAYAAQDL